MALFELPASRRWVWLGALLVYDFCYYWLHRAGHRVAVLWAAHVVHHQSEDYNLSTALRQTSSGFLLGWIFYLPMALVGVPPLVFGVVALVDLLYQFWVHTQQVGKLGWFDRWFCSPSNHRVHHAVNDRYLDSNYGGILIVWDRLFGSFSGRRCRALRLRHARAAAQLEPAVGQPGGLSRWRWTAGARAPGPTSCGCGSSRRAGGRPTWRSDCRSRRSRSAAVRRYDPALAHGAAWAAALLFVAVIGGLSLFLWNAHRLARGELLLGGVAIMAALWLIGAITQPRRDTSAPASTRPASR